MPIKPPRKTLPLLLILAILLASCARAPAASAGTGKVSSVTITDSVETSGNLDAGQLKTLTWGTSGLVDKVNISTGHGS